MDKEELIALAAKGAQAAVDAAALFTKAISAANNGDMAAAEQYLQQSRDHYAQSRDAWDAAGA